MNPQGKTIPISESAKLILETMRVEFMPLSGKIKDLAIRINTLKISYHIFSKKLKDLEDEYFKSASDFIVIDTKLKTPDILFENFKEQSPENMIAYFQYQPAFLKNLEESSKDIDLMDRALDRKRQSIQNNRNTLLALIAIFLSVFLGLLQLVLPQNINPVEIKNNNLQAEITSSPSSQDVNVKNDTINTRITNWQK